MATDSTVVVIYPSGRVEQAYTRVDLGFLQGAVDGMIEGLLTHPQFVAFGNEDARGKQMDPNPLAQYVLQEFGRFFPVRLRGPVVFVGPADARGNTKAMPARTAEKIIAVAQQLLDPPHMKDEGRSCPGCGARWDTAEKQIEHALDCLYIAVSVAGL